MGRDQGEIGSKEKSKIFELAAERRETRQSRRSKSTPPAHEKQPRLSRQSKPAFFAGRAADHPGRRTVIAVLRNATLPARPATFC
jgi:hypothetical protein